MARRISSPVLVGRRAELQAFDLALEEARAGHAGLIVLAGEAGAGKSRLLAEFAARTRALGGAAVVGAASPPAGGARAPFAALLPVLRGLVRSLDARLIEPLLGGARSDLAALLPELGAPPPAVDDPGPFAQARLTEAVLVTIEVVARHRSLVLLALDDLQWADAATLAIVAYVARNLVDAPVVMVVAYRSDALSDGDAFVDVLAEMGRSPTAETLELGALDAEEVAAQVSAILGGDPEREMVQALVRRSSGNPFFVEELLVAVLEGGLDRPPPSVRTMTEARMARLTPASRAIVEILALAGGETPAGLLASTAGMSPALFDRSLREAQDANLLVSPPTPSSSGHDPRPELQRVDLRHVLVREVITQAISAPRRRELHARLASAIERDPSAAGGSPLEVSARLATQWLLAGQMAQAVHALLDEARAAEQARSFVTASQAYQQALLAWRPMLAHPGLAGLDLVSVLDRAALAASLAGDPLVAVALAEEALAAHPPDAAASEREVGMRLHLGIFQGAAGLDEMALVTLRAALADAPGGSVLAVRCGIALAQRLEATGRDVEAAAAAVEAARAAEAAGARREAAQAHSVHAVALARLGHTAEALAALHRASPRPGSRGRRRTSPGVSRPSVLEAEVLALHDRSGTLELAGDPGAAAGVALEGRELAHRYGLSAGLGELMSAVAARDLMRVGRWTEAAQLLAGSGESSRAARPEVALVRALLSCRRGDWSATDVDLAAWRAVRDATSAPGWVAFGHLVQAEHACWRRRYAEARSLVAAGVPVAEAERDRNTLVDLAILGIRIEADAARNGPHAVVGDIEAVGELAAGYVVRLDALLQGPTGPGGEISQRDQACLATGTAEEARLRGAAQVDAWDEATRAWDLAHGPFEAAYARFRSAEALLSQSGDRERARAAASAALRATEVLGALALAGEIRAIRTPRQAGERR